MAGDLHPNPDGIYNIALPQGLRKANALVGPAYVLSEPVA
jgi:hypothetical protein